MYKITDDTKDKVGYLCLDNTYVLLYNPRINKNELKLAKIEIFGRAAKVSFYKNKMVEYEIDYFSDSPIKRRLVSQLRQDLFFYEFNNITLALNRASIEGLSNYADAIERDITYFYEVYNNTPKTKPYNINTLSGIEFEVLCKKLLQKMGFDTRQTKASGDGGIDLIAKNHQPLIEGTYIVQCKRYTGSVGEPVIRDLYGVVCAERANKGILITTGTFTSSAISFAEDKNIELIDGDYLNVLLKKYSINTDDFVENNVTTVSMSQIIENNKAFLKTHNVDFNLIFKLNKLDEQPSNEILRANCIQKLFCGFHCLCLADAHQSEIDLFAKELKKQISLYNINHNKNNKKTQYLADIYIMIDIQVSIVVGDFYYAIKTFFDLISRRELIYNICENNIKNKELRDCEAIVLSLLKTIYDVVQVAVLLEDMDLAKRIYNVSKNIIEVVRGYYSFILIDEDVNELYKNYARYEYDRLEKIYELNSLYIMTEELLPLFYSWTYEGREGFFDFSNALDIRIENNSLVIGCFHTITDIKEKIKDAKQLL